jgi:ElaB/YqjD/DUF883 family membrane-anchored ribosome-binding protein
MNANPELMDDLTDAIQPAQPVARKAARTLSAAKASLHDGTERVKATTRHAADSTDRFVHSNPWSVIGVAVAAGAAIAMLMGTRMRR